MIMFLFAVLTAVCLASGLRSEIMERRRLARMAQECKEREA